MIVSEKKKLFATRSSNIDQSLITTYAQPKNAAWGVRYKGRHYETGPLARLLFYKHPLVRKLHRRYKDAVITRISARVWETGALLEHIRTALEELELAEPSWIEAPKKASGEGVGCVEAARGSLMHRIKVKDGVIEAYEIITPTQWNLANGDEEERGVAIKAIENSPKEWSELVFKSFDVCSVCTTH
jgi:hydrogenase large subunit